MGYRRDKLHPLVVLPFQLQALLLDRFVYGLRQLTFVGRLGQTGKSSLLQHLYLDLGLDVASQKDAFQVRVCLLHAPQEIHAFHVRES